MRDYTLMPPDYDNALPLFLGGPHHGAVRLVKAEKARGTDRAEQPALLTFPGIATDEPVKYQRWSLNGGARNFVFYRLLGMSDAGSVGALVGLAMRSAVNGCSSVEIDTSKPATGIQPL